MVSESELWEVLESCQRTVRPEWKAAGWFEIGEK